MFPPIKVRPGSTDVSVPVYLRQNKASGLEGDPQTGVIASGTSNARYWRVGPNGVATITLSDLANLTTPHADGGFKEISSTHFPGAYRLDLPDAAIAAGASAVMIGVQKAVGSNWYCPPTIVLLDYADALWARFAGKHEEDLVTGAHKFYELDGTTELMTRVEAEITNAAGNDALEWS